VGGSIELAAAEDWNEGKVLEASGVLDKMIPIRRKTVIRGMEALDRILHASSRARLAAGYVMIVTVQSSCRRLWSLYRPNMAEFGVNNFSLETAREFKL
jgi:hypothetical protein